MLAGMGSFDNALLEALLSIGVSPERARAVVDSLGRSVDGRYSLHAQVLATKRDLAELETRLAKNSGDLEARLLKSAGDLEARLLKHSAEMEARLAREITQTNARVAETNVRIAETRADLTKWMLAALTAQTALLLGAIKLF